MKKKFLSVKTLIVLVSVFMFAIGMVFSTGNLPAFATSTYSSNPGTSGTVERYYANSSYNLVYKDTLTNPGGDNLIKTYGLLSHSDNFTQFKFELYNGSRATNYRTNSDGKYRGEYVGGGIAFVINTDNNSVVRYNKFNFDMDNETTLTLSLQGVPTTGNYRIEIAYKYRNNIIASKGNYIVYKTPIISCSSPTSSTTTFYDGNVNPIVNNYTTTDHLHVLTNGQIGFYTKNGGALTPLGSADNIINLSIGSNVINIYNLYGDLQFSRTITRG